MEKPISDLIVEMRELKSKQMEISHKLISIILKDEALAAGLKSGLVKLNFPAPAGFYRNLSRF